MKHYQLLIIRKINLKTKEITARTYNDYFTYSLKVQYLPDLKQSDNKFYQFNKSLWNNEEEFKYWRKINGKIISVDEHDNLIIVWEHPLGGGGKTIWLNCIHNIFRNTVNKLTIDTFKKGRRNNKAFELCKLYGRTLAYCDENTRDEVKSNKETIDFALILDLSGGGMQEFIDKYKKVTNSIAEKCTATIFFAGNRGYFNCRRRIPALERRLIMFNTEPFFRNPGDPDYDASNPNCRPKIPNLEKDLLENKDHIFTWFVNCANEFLNDRQDLHTIQPERFKKYQQSVIDNNNERYDNGDPMVLDLLKQYIKC